MPLNLTALLLLCAGTLHFIAAPERFASHAALGVCFIVLGLLQIVLAYLLIQKPTKKLVLFGIGFNTGLLVLWLLSQVLPGLAGNGREPLSLLSGLRKILELISVELLIQYSQRMDKSKS